MKEIKEILRKFNDERDWSKFHTPENLSKSISIEAAEILECFQWDNNFNKDELSDEIADVVIYCIMLADKIDIDLKKEILRKIKVNEKKYPIEKCKGISKKYNEL